MEGEGEMRKVWLVIVDGGRGVGARLGSTLLMVVGADLVGQYC